MNKSVFISGSKSINSLDENIIESLENIIKKNIPVLIGDASGIDRIVQNYFSKKNYLNVTIYSIYNTPRYCVHNSFNKKQVHVPLKIKNEFEKQQEKDAAMTNESEYSFVIWDEKSRGSYSNIIRALELNKKTKIYSNLKTIFFEKEEILIENIENIFKVSNNLSFSQPNLFQDEVQC